MQELVSTLNGAVTLNRYQVFDVRLRGAFLDTRKARLLHYAVFFCAKFDTVYAKELF